MPYINKKGEPDMRDIKAPSLVEVSAIVLFGIIIMGVCLILVPSANAITDNELEQFVSDNSQSIVERLDRGEIVEINGTKMVKRNGTVYGLGVETEEQKADRLKRWAKEEENRDRDAKWQHELDIAKTGSK